MTIALPANPFPGMNPYLESRRFWPGIHTRLIAGLDRFLALQLRPGYIVSIGQRVYVEAEPETGRQRRFRIPDAMLLDDRSASSASTASAAAAAAAATAVETRQKEGAIAVQLPATELEKEHYLEVLRVDNREVVAVIELLSPTNKWGDGRNEYLAKRAEVKHSTAHLVEIDLLRAEAPMPVVGAVPAGDYRILVRNARLSPRADLYVFGMQGRIPEFVLPLAEGDEGITVSLKPILDDVYAIGSYDRDIDYGRDPEPPLSDADRVWVDGLLRAQGLRQ